MDNSQDLQDNFWRTRLDAKAAYKKWKSSVGKTALVRQDELLKDYFKAWEAHQKANMEQFLDECEESK